jgi:hypothetical protein
MKKVIGLDNWKMDNLSPNNEERIIYLSIYFKYPEIDSLISKIPQERKLIISNDLRQKYKSLVHEFIFKDFEIIGSSMKPRGIKVKAPFSLLKIIAERDEIETIFIENIQNAKKIKNITKPKYFCIKMTIAIEVEGKINGLQDFEERFVLIKAKSSDEAIMKLEKNNDEYSKPYLNPYGQLVRWRMESIDDCFETDIDNLKEFNKSEGVEVFSRLKSRRLTKERIWKGDN